MSCHLIEKSTHLLQSKLVHEHHYFALLFMQLQTSLTKDNMLVIVDNIHWKQNLISCFNCFSIEVRKAYYHFTPNKNLLPNI